MNKIRFVLRELFYLDFMKFWLMFHGKKAFSAYGVKDRYYLEWQTSHELVQRWKDGMTGMPYVDACMRELN